MHLAVALVLPEASGCSRGRPSEGSPHRASKRDRHLRCEV